MIKSLRVIFSLLFFCLITFYFLDFAGLLPFELHYLTKIQFIPALLALNVIILLVLILLTLIFGRIYCSSVCPMGVYQDCVGKISKTVCKKKRYSYSPQKKILRWSVLAISFITFFLGIHFILNLIEPYSAWGRVSENVLKPVYISGNNLLEKIFTGYNNYRFYKVDASILSVFSFIIGLLSLITIGLLTWKNGRTFCNTICPTGTILGFLSKYSLLKINIDKNKCNGCGLCSIKCKASCIDSKAHSVDHSRCINCFNCLNTCNHGALKYSYVKKDKKSSEDTPDNSKRTFLTVALPTLFLAQKIKAKEKIDNITSSQKAYKRKNPIAPPGAQSIKHLQSHCTACHLCISKCPSRVLKPAFTEYGLGGIMQPIMFFEKGFCNFDCTVCSEVCPNGALLPLTKQKKHITQVGKVVFIKDNCIVYTDGTSCGACSEHCPTQAVSMIPYKDGLTIPSVETDICMGCGGCEYICPVRPYRAIHVEGNSIQVDAKPFTVQEKVEIEIDDFGF